MSWQKSLLNPLLRLIEKRQMANAKEPSSLRRAFEFKAKILFHAPRGTEMEWFDLGGTSALRIGGEGLDAGKVILYCHGGGHVLAAQRRIQRWWPNWPNGWGARRSCLCIHCLLRMCFQRH